ncbi:transcriptional activator MltR, partial [Pseudomonas savastanoi pv. glycinea str. race 4]
MIFVSDRALKLKIRHIIVLATAEHDIAMSKTTRIAGPSYELMDDHNGLSIIYREHGFPCPLVRWQPSQG